MRSRFLAATALVSVFTLAACSAESAPDADAQSPTEDTGTVAFDVPEGWHYVEGDAQPSADADPQLPTTVVDGTGAEVEIDDISRIIVGGDDVAEILGALGLADDVYAAPAGGASQIALDAPVQFELSQSTGTEGLLSIDGSLFIGNNPRRHGDVAQQFRDAAVDAVVYDDQQPTADKIRTVAEYIGDVEAGEEIATAIDADLAEASRIAEGLEDLRVLHVTSSGAGGANAVVGTGTAGADIAEAIGVTSIGVENDLRGYSVEYSDEGLLSTQPDVILMGTADLEEWGGIDGFVEAFPTLVDTPAWENDQIYVMPSTQIKVSGPAMGVGARALAEALAANAG